MNGSPTGSSAQTARCGTPRTRASLKTSLLPARQPILMQLLLPLLLLLQLLLPRPQLQQPLSWYWCNSCRSTQSKQAEVKMEKRLM